MSDIPFQPFQYKDFVPKVLKKGGIFSKSQFETLADTLAEANEWIAAHPQHNVTHIETVVLPNIHSTNEEGSEDPELRDFGEASTNYYQFFRVWYR